jgi:hypothetical protein
MIILDYQRDRRGRIMKITFIILWGISVLVWLVFAISTIVNIITDGDYVRYCILMLISVAFMYLFKILIDLS